MLVEIFPNIDIDIRINKAAGLAAITIINKRAKTSKLIGRKTLGEAYMLFNKLLAAKRQFAEQQKRGYQ